MTTTNLVDNPRLNPPTTLDTLREEPTPSIDWSAEYDVTDDSIVNTGTPLRIALVESLLLVIFVRAFWVPEQGGARPRPGLSSARLPDDIGVQLLSLYRLVRDSIEEFLLATAPRESVTMLGRGEFVLGELKAAIEHHADDGEVNALDAQVDELARLHMGADSYLEVAEALDDYAAVAQPLRHELAGLGGFSASMIDEARDLALQLRVAKRHTGPLNAEQKKLLSQRNRYLRMLWKRVQMVRRAAQFVFRHHPEIAIQATSAYRRQKNAEARRRKLQEQKTKDAAQAAKAAGA